MRYVLIAISGVLFGAVVPAVVIEPRLSMLAIGAFIFVVVFICDALDRFINRV